MIETQEGEKRKASEFSSDESDASEEHNSYEEVDENKSELTRRVEDASIYSYFKDLEFDLENCNRSIKDRKYSEEKIIPPEFSLESHLNITEEIENTSSQNFVDFNSEEVLKLIENKNKETLKSIEYKILKNGFVKSEVSTNELIINEITHSKYYEIVTLEVQYNFYKTKIQILNNVLNTQIHNEGQLGGFGAFGHVYLQKFLHENYAVKCIRFNPIINFQNESNFLNRENIFMTVLKEYFFILLFSALEIGPKAKKMMGFDLIVSEECIEFTTEVCTIKEMQAFEKKELKKSLRKLHALKIVHRDIKPDNIMYSDFFKKHVFIDFGGCLFIKENLGEKSFSGFLGTTGFCTDEMFNLLGSSKSYVDLYANDLFGLNRTFERQKELKRNLTQKMLFEQTQIDIQSIKGTSTPFCLLNFIKFLIYNQQYNDFQLYWKLIEKNYIAFLDELQIELLNFFMDLESNEHLKEFYWKNIEESIRTNFEFQNLYEFFSNEPSDSFALWKSFPTKEKKFSTNIYFYSRLAINHGPYDQKSKKILKILHSKDTIESEIFSKKKYLRNENLPHEVLQISEIEIFFLILVNYCSFVQNKYSAEFSMKVMASEIGNYIIEEIFQETYKKNELMYRCESLAIESLAKMFHYFIVYFLEKIPAMFKESSMTNCISSLLLLGYPIYLNEAKQQLGYHLLKENESSRVMKIVRFWEFNLILLNFGNLLYDRNVENFINYCSAHETKEIQDLYSNIMRSESEENDEFFKVNNYFYINIYLNHENLNEISLKEALDKLEHNHDFKVLRDENLEKWRIVMKTILTFLATAYEIHYQFLDFSHINKYNKIILKNDINCIPYLFSIPSAKYEIWSSFIKLHQIIKVVDKIINYNDVSYRYFTSSRILVAYKTKNFKELKILIELILKTTSKFSLHNVFLIQEQLRVVQYLISHETQRNHFTNFMYKHNLFTPLISQAVEMGELFSDLTNDKNPLTKFKNDEEKDLKNAITVVSTVHLLLHNLKLILENYLSLNSKKENSHILCSQSPYLEFESEKNYNSNLQRVKKCLSNLTNCFDITPYLSNGKDSKNRYAVYLMNYYINEMEFDKAEQLFESLFGFIKTIDKESLEVKPALNIFIIYCILKTKSASHESIFWYEKLLDTYESSKKRNFWLDPFKYPIFFMYFFSAMIYCEKSFQEIEEMLHFVMKCLKMAPTRINAEKINSIIKSRFRCTCSDCFSIFSPKWIAKDFIEYLVSKIKEYDHFNDSYMSFVFYYCIENKEISFKTNKKIIEFIRKSMNHLSFPIRSIIAYRLNSYRLQFFNTNVGLNHHFETFAKEIGLEKNLTQEQRIFKEKQFLSNLGTKFDEKIFKKQMYFYMKHVKNHNETQSLTDASQRLFFYKESVLKNFNLPPNIKKIYEKKLLKYHFIGQKYRPIYPPSEYEIRMAKIYFDK